MKILAIAEQRDGKFRKPASEVTSEAFRISKKLNAECVAAVVGSKIEGIAAELGQYGPAKALVVDDPALGPYSTEGYAHALHEIVKKENPDVILLPASSMGKDLAPRLAQKLSAGLVQDCTHVDVENGNLIFTRPMYAGKVLAKIAVKGKPQMATLRPNVFKAEAVNAGAKATVEKVPVSGFTIRAKVKEIVASAAGKVDLTEANIIVSGGRGMKGPENYKVIEALAEVLGATVGASRAAVDAGWRPHDDQVGQTGKVVSPSLYIACGISGAIQHLAGMSSSKVIVAVNKDADAPIFKVADYGIVGDLFEIVPQMTEEVKKLLGK
jgi:electron transfer flavoprotein alpha subunit